MLNGLLMVQTPITRTPSFRWSVQWHLWVYKFETYFLGSPNHAETALQAAKTRAIIFLAQARNQLRRDYAQILRSKNILMIKVRIKKHLNIAENNQSNR